MRNIFKEDNYLTPAPLALQLAQVELKINMSCKFTTQILPSNLAQLEFFLVNLLVFSFEN